MPSIATVTRGIAAAFGMAVLMAGGSAAAADGRTAHDFTFIGIEGGSLPMRDFAGRPVLVVNTASLCGFTRQYAGLQELWERYRGRGLVVLGVPSDDFGGQEPGDEAEIKRFCEVNFGIDFPMTAKKRVTGDDAHPFYLWAADLAGPEGRPAWNFHKYLVGPDGDLVASFPTRTEPTSETVVAAVEALLERP